MPDSDSSPPIELPDSPGPSRLGAWALILGLLAGLLAWLCGELALGHFAPSPELAARASRLGSGENPELSLEFSRQSLAAETRNIAVAQALLGMSLGLAMGLAGGFARRHLRSGLGAGLIGMVLGGVAAGGLTLGVLPTYRRLQVSRPDDLLVSVLILGAIWGAVGLMSGLCLGIGAGRRRDAWLTSTGGFAGAIVGTLVYVLIGSLAFANTQIDRLLTETWETRLLARLVIAAAVAAGAWLGATLRAGRAPSPRP